MFYILYCQYETMYLKINYIPLGHKESEKISTAVNEQVWLKSTRAIFYLRVSHTEKQVCS